MAKEKLYTIPLNDAVDAHDECPFCFVERKIEQDLMDFVLGSCSSYMEADVREVTDKMGFCRTHFKKMFDYGNTLGNAWILKTHYIRTLKEMEDQFKKYSPTKMSFKEKIRKPSGTTNPVSAWIRKRDKSCYICSRYEDTYERYLDTFVIMYGRDLDFKKKILESKGFCLSHFGDLCEYAELNMSDKEKAEFFPAMFKLMQDNFVRVGEDVAWMVEKFDYRNADADWKNSKDAIQRGMQKMKGAYPADAPYKMSK